jgi:hypothetical protein
VLQFVFQLLLKRPQTQLQHTLNKFVDLFLTVTGVTTFVKVNEFGFETTKRGRKFERVEEVVGLFEAATTREDLVNEILHAGNSMFAKCFVNHQIISQGNTLLVNFSETTFVNEFTYSLEVRFTVGNEWLDKAKHVQSSTVHLDEDTVVNLTKTKELQNFTGFWWDTNDTTNTYNADNFSFWFVVKLTGSFGFTLVGNLLVLKSLVLFDVGLGRLEGFGAQFFLVLTLLERLLFASRSKSGVALLFF